MTLKGEIVKSNIFHSSGRIIGIILSFFLSIFLARFIGPLEFGFYTFTKTVANFFLVFTDFGLRMALIKFVAKYINEDDNKKTKNIILTVLKYKFILALTVSAFIMVFSPLISTFIFNKPEGSEFVFLSGLVLFSSVLFDFVISLLSALKNFKYVGAISVLQMLLNILFVSILVFLGFGTKIILLGLIFSFIASILIFIFMITRKYSYIFSENTGNPPIEMGIIKNFTFFVFLGSIFTVVYSFIDEFLVTVFLSMEWIGFYSIAKKWSMSLTFLIPISSLVFYRYFSGSDSKEILKKMLLKSLKYSSAYIIPFAFLLFLFSREIILTFYGSSYSSSVQILQILSFITIPVFASSLIYNFFCGVGKPNIGVKVIILSSIFNATLGYFLIQIWGATGIAISAIVGNAFQLILFLYSLHKEETFLPEFSIFWKPLISCIISYVFLRVFFGPTTMIFMIVFGGLFIIAYFILLFFMKGIDREMEVFFKEKVQNILINKNFLKKK